MNLGDYVHLNYENYQKYGLNAKKPGSSNGYELLEAEKEKMFNKWKGRTVQKGYKELEEFYNEMMYNKESQSHLNMVKYLERSIGDLLTKYSIDMENGLGSKNMGYYKFGEKRFRPEKVEELKNKIDNILKNISSSDNKIEEKQKKLKELQKLIEENQKEYNEAAEKGWVHNDSDFKNYKNFINKLNELLEELNSMAAMTAVGESFERFAALAHDRLKEVTEAEADKIIEEELLTGTKRDNIVFSSEINKYHKALKSTFNTPIDNRGGNVEITEVDDINLKSIYKMDVKLLYNNEEYRISAKNYYLKNSKNISLVSGRSLLMLLMNNLSTKTINHTLNLLYSKGSSDVSRSYSILKRIIAIDALTGMFQKEGYADTLVINNRSGQKIHVIPMTFIIKAMDENLDKFITISPSSDIVCDNSYNKKIDNIEDGEVWQQARKRIENLLIKIRSIKLHASLKYNSLKDIKY